MSLPRGNKLTSLQIKKTPFLLFQSHPDDFRETKDDNNSALKEKFFNNKNIELLQKEIIKRVYIKSKKKYLIEKQNVNDVITIMKSVFDDSDYDRNLKNMIIYLNKMVVEKIVSMIISEIEFNNSYLDRTYNQPDFYDRPKNVSKCGLKNSNFS